MRVFIIRVRRTSPEKYYSEVVKKNVKITHEIGDRDYGIRDFGLADNNGFILIFGQDVD